MAKAVYIVRATTKAHATAKITKLNLPTINNQYTHDAATQFILGLNRMIKSTYNPSSGQGMVQLLRSSTDAVNRSNISDIKSTNSATITTVLDKSIAEVKKFQVERATPKVAIAPSIVTQADAIDAADRQYMLNQLGIGAKEGAIKAITEKVGISATDTVLRTADSTDYKFIGEYKPLRINCHFTTRAGEKGFSK